MRTLVLLLVLSGCAGSSQPAGESVAETWTALEAGHPFWEHDTVDCRDVWGALGTRGARGPACQIAQVQSLGALAARSGFSVWTSGPHGGEGQTLGLDLQSDDFGRYNPAFVAWAVDHIVPESPVLRALAQRVYDRDLRTIARAHWLALQSLQSDGFPDAEPWDVARYRAYLLTGQVPPGVRPGEDGGISIYDVFASRARQSVRAEGGDRLDPVYRVGLQFRGVVGASFWVRRQEDGTSDLFAQGLDDLLTAFDAEWVSARR
ncbi:MAG: hypothetical protein AAGK21_07520 [Bacteroidota bacterium]